MRPQVVYLSDASGGAIESNWVNFDAYAPNGISLQVSAFGTVSYTVLSTLDDPNDPTDPIPIANITWIPINDADFVNATASAQGNYNWTPRYAKVVLNSGTGSVIATFVQNSAVPL